MKIAEAIKKRIAEGNDPHYNTKRGKLLWVDTEHYDDYSSINHCKILVDANGKFWGYSNDPRVTKIKVEG